MHDTHVEHCKYQEKERRQVTTTIHGNMLTLQHTKRSKI